MPSPCRRPRPRFAAVALAAVLFALAASAARADMVLSEVIVDFGNGDAQIQDVEVGNEGTDTLYIRTTPYRVIDPGAPSERREQIVDPSSAGLVVSPERFILQPGERRLIRFVLAQPPSAEERVYRVDVRPQVGRVEGEATGVKILIAYEMLVIVRPADPQVAIDVSRQGDRLVASNRGNTSVLLSPIEQCRTEGDCDRLAGVRVYPGRTEQIALPRAAPVSVYHAAGDRNWRETY